jgi:LmbE family N-acetylglucosaminyl deacetylase
MISFKNVLVLAPHTDDGELGAGGFISKLIEEGANVRYAAFSTASESVPEGFDENILKIEVRNATKVLGIKPEHLHVYDYRVRSLNNSRQSILEELITLRSNYSFDLILLPSLKDIHQDHLTIAQEGLRAFKGYNVFGYELIWNNLNFNTCGFIRLDKKHIQRKVEALKEYKSQSHRSYMSEDFIFSLAKTRGVQIGCDYAEAYEIIRLVI